MKSSFAVTLLMCASNLVLVGCAGMSEVELIKEAKETGDWTKVHNRSNRLGNMEAEKEISDFYFEQCSRRGRTVECIVMVGGEKKCICAGLGFKRF